MVRYDRRSIFLAAGLSALAGYVDAIGFLHLGGFFISFMSGNSTRLAVSLAGADWQQASIAGGILLSFLAGVIAGTFCGHLAGAHRQPLVLGVQALVLAAAVSLHAFGHNAAGTAAMALAMGIENTVFLRDGEVSIGLTYMTGTLVKMGQRLAAVALGGRPLAWFPYFALWCGLLSGAVLGAVVFSRIGLSGLWVAVGMSAVASLCALLIKTPEG